MLSDGSYGTIDSIGIEALLEPEVTYNFEVADYHTYYVGECNVLVHNVRLAGEIVMSEILAAKIKLNKTLESEIISDMLFSVVKEGCNRKIAIHILQRGSSFDGINIPHLALDEIIILFTDSYNRDLTNPLIGHDRDYEVKEYRAESLQQRLKNIQEYLEFIFNQENVLLVNVIWDIENLTFDDKNIDVSLKDFAKFMTKSINATEHLSHYQFCWRKPC